MIAGGGDRTRTTLSDHRILSPVRLPVPPPRRADESIARRRGHDVRALESAAKAHHSLNLRITEGAVRGDASVVVNLRVARNLFETCRTSPSFCRSHQRSPGTAATLMRIYVPTFDERHRRRAAARRILPLIELEEAQ